MAYSNPVVEVYKGIKIRRYNTCNLKFSSAMFKMLILESERTGIPITKLLIFSSKPCEACVNTDIIVYNQEDEAVKIKRGLLSRHHPENHGRSITEQSKEKNKK